MRKRIGTDKFGFPLYLDDHGHVWFGCGASIHANTEQDAIAAWNRRVPAAQPAQKQGD